MKPKVKKSRAEVPFDNTRRQHHWAQQALKRVSRAVGGHAEAVELLRTVGLRRLRDARDDRRDAREAAASDASVVRLIASLDLSRQQLLGPCLGYAEAACADISLPVADVPDSIRRTAAEVGDLIAHLEWVRSLARRKFRFAGPDWRRAAARLYDETDLTWPAIAVLSLAVVRGEARTDGSFPLVDRRAAKKASDALKEAASAYGRGPEGTPQE